MNCKFELQFEIIYANLPMLFRFQMQSSQKKVINSYDVSDEFECKRYVALVAICESMMPVKNNKYFYVV